MECTEAGMKAIRSIRKGARVLVADDDPAVRRLIAHILRSVKGAKVVQAADGLEAWKRFSSEPFDLVVTDWEMPGWDGVSLVRAIREANSPVPILMATVRCGREHVLEAIQAGATDFLAKPFVPATLREKLERYCDHVEALKQLDLRPRTVMRAEYINPFLTSMVSLFDTMLVSPLTRGVPFPKKSLQPHYDISGIIGMTGRARGTVVLSFARETALGVTDFLLGKGHTTIDVEVMDTVGELANIVAGAAKAQLDHLELRVSLPMIITGRNHSVEFPSAITPVCIPFDSPLGPLAIEVGLADLKS